MADFGVTEAAAIRLAELSREVDDLETGRTSLLNRLDRVRATLVAAGQRTAAMRASVDLLCEHISNIASALAELRALEEEMRELEQGLGGNEREATGLVFEADGLEAALDEAEDDLERVSAILIDGKTRYGRGH
ncbi:MAG TPA: hypothetical protein VJQ56_02825 [Blastocatellia bacterium]|nr:hypothetical protein [Blastocatellia bacterium]